MVLKERTALKKFHVTALIFFLLLLAVLLVFRAYLRRENERKAIPTLEGREMIIPFTADQISAFSLFMGDEERFSYRREDGRWIQVSDPDAQIDQTEVGKLAASLTGVPVTGVIENVTDLSQYGLLDPAMRLTVTASSGDTVVLEIGDVNDMTQDVYCLKPGHGENAGYTVYAVSAALTAVA